MEKKSPEKCSINPSIFHRNKMGATWFSHSELFMPVFSFFSGIFSRTADKIKPKKTKTEHIIQLLRSSCCGSAG